MQLLLSSSWWLLPLCLIIGIGYAWLLYQKNIKSDSYKLMAILRCISVTALCFFLLGPILVRIITEKEKPKILMALDNSQSILASGDNESIKKNFLEQWRAVKNELGDDYEVEFLTLGGDIEVSDSANFTAKRTDIGRLFDYINKTYARQNVGAVVLASDGIYNRGANPSFKKFDNHALLYTIGLGDSTLKRDLILKSANANAIAYLNNEYPVELDIWANECQGQTTTLNISSEGKTLHTQVIAIDKKDFFKTIIVNLPADKPGTLHLVVTLSNLNNEYSKANNRKDVFIDIIDGREKILLAYHGAHPDIGALKESIQSNKNYEVVTSPISSVNSSQINQYSLAILHQLPSKSNNAKQLIDALKKAKIPIWVVCGTQTAIEQLGNVSSPGRIDRNQGRNNESQAVISDAFNAFTLEETTRKTIPDWPPLICPYGMYAASNTTEILAYQKIGSVTTNNPLWTFSNQNGEKTAYLFGEGFWKWRLFDFLENESHAASDELVSKTIQYLTIKEDKRKFRVYPIKPVFEEDEPVRFIAELYNASYELVNISEVKLKLKNEEGKVFDYTFSKNNRSYGLDIGLLNPGIYSYTAISIGTNDKITGKIMVKAAQAELIETRANFGLLRNMSANNGGEFIQFSQIKELSKKIRSNGKVTDMTFTEKRPDDLINFKWVFFILAGIIALEWFIRKYEGGY